MKKYILRKQVKGKGYYAEFLYDIFFTESDSNSLEVTCHVSEWEYICRTGALIFHEYFQRRNVGNVKIVVHDVKWYPIDTNNLIILFASVNAFAEGLDFKIDNLKLDVENEIFCFPDARTI